MRELPFGMELAVHIECFANYSVVSKISVTRLILGYHGVLNMLCILL